MELFFCVLNKVIIIIFIINQISDTVFHKQYAPNIALIYVTSLKYDFNYKVT